GRDRDRDGVLSGTPARPGDRHCPRRGPRSRQVTHSGQPADRLPVPRAVPRAVRPLRPGPDPLRSVDQPARVGLPPARQALRRPGELRRPVQPRDDHRWTVLAVDARHGHLHRADPAAAGRPPLAHRRAAGPQVPRPRLLPGGHLRAVRPRCRRHRHPVALPARPERRRAGVLPGPGRHRQPALAHRHPVGVGSARHPDDLVDARVQHGDLPGRPAGHLARAVRSGRDGRGQRRPAVPQRHSAGPAADHGLRGHDHAAGVCQPLRPVLHHHPGSARRGDAVRDHADLRGGPGPLQHGHLGGDEHHPDPVPAADQPGHALLQPREEREV
ncbi:MAG: ABC transporter, permease protein 1 (cluster 1, maltose/g3p/polyamine/iron), partial [uncultured Friedmanniella sp.]